MEAEIHFENGVNAMNAGNYGQAVEHFQQAILEKQDYAVAWGNRGNCLLTLGRPFDALVSLKQAISIAPNYADFHNSLGNAYAKLNKNSNALACYNLTLTRDPKHHFATGNMATILMEKGEIEEAIRLYRKSLELDDSYMGHVHLGMALIKNGQLKEGWRDYEYRARILKQNSRGMPVPQWTGQPLKDKTLLVYAEQGHGDTIQFMRYAPIVKKMTGAKVILEVRAPLSRIAKTLEGIDGVSTLGEETVKADYAVSMMSLPMICKTNTAEDIPGETPYLLPSRASALNWTRKLAILPKGFKVGLCWSGMSRTNQPEARDVDRRRSLHLSQLARLGQIPDVTWVSLQKGAQGSQALSPTGRHDHRDFNR